MVKSSIAAVAAGLFGASALAQTATPERVPQQAQQNAAEQQRAAEAALAREEGLGAPISFEEILRNPDDIGLNFRYARQKVQEGDLKSASSTLERILLVQPNLTQIRLLYAIVLFRLDNLQEAEREFRAVQPAGGAITAEANKYLGDIAQRQKQTKVTASLGAGLDYNSNRDAVPRSKQRLVNDVPASTVNGGRNDYAQILLGTVGIRHDLGSQDRHELIGNATLYWANQAVVDEQDLRAGTLEAGGVFRLPWFNLTPTLTYTRVSLNHEHFLDARGMKLRADRQIDQRIEVYGQFWAQYQNFATISIATVAP
jgi:tetratricopeptide (TPR) repeat protein